MLYKFEKEREDYSLYAPGNAFIVPAGFAPFPVRLGSELFQRAVQHLGVVRPVVLYDPLCGSGYMVATIAARNRQRIKMVVGSDVQKQCVELARRNLRILTVAGCNSRLDELCSMERPRISAKAFTEELKGRAMEWNVPYKIFVANATDDRQLLVGMNDVKADVVIFDTPYGKLTDWSNQNSGNEPLKDILAAVEKVLAESAVVVFATYHKYAVDLPGFKRVERLKVGRRFVTMYTHP